MNSDIEPLERLTFEVATMMHQHLPKLRNRNKSAVYAIACPAGFRAAGTITYTRWWGMQLPATLHPSQRATVDVRPDVYDYTPVDPGDPAAEWHVNFADPQLFFGYGTRLLAQDEAQVAEHPALGSLLEALRAGGHKPVTVEANMPTPVLIAGAERRVKVDTAPNAKQGRPGGIYGNRFGDEDVETVVRATSLIDPPTITNLIAMAAPHGGSGRYKWDEIHSILINAYTGFRAAVLESVTVAGVGARTIVHSGFWGCGAFGGNRTMMTMLQVLASHLAGIDQLVFHAVDAAGADQAAEAAEMIERQILAPNPRRPGGLVRSMFRRDNSPADEAKVSEIMWRIVGLAIEWGVSDGN